MCLNPGQSGFRAQNLDLEVVLLLRLGVHTSSREMEQFLSQYLQFPWQLNSLFDLTTVPAHSRNSNKHLMNEGIIE